MVSEFLTVTEHPVTEPLPPFSRKLSTPRPGVQIASAKSAKNHTVTIGIHRTPEQFIDAALEVGHPTNMHSLFPSAMHKVVNHIVEKIQQSLAQERTAELRRWALMSEQLQDENAEMLKNSSSRIKNVLTGKRLALMKTLLADAGHGDFNLVHDIINGFDLTGPLPEAHVFRKKFRPATIPCQDLRNMADVCRKALMSNVCSSGDPDLDNGLMEATCKELNKGFLTGPINQDALPMGATLTRRFPVRQKNKIRPIDDYRASMVNSSVTQTEGVSVHTIDHIAAMISLWMRVSASRGRNIGLKAKCWDLSDAYKQLPLSDHAFENDSYLVVFDPETGGPVIFQQKVLPFGSIASVTSFLRLSLAIWTLGTELLHLAWSSYFDDFLSLSEDGLEKHTDMVISFLFSTLGWKLSTEKLVDFDTICKVLGVSLDLTETKLGTAVLQNTAERTEELVSELQQVLEEKILSRKDAERLRGRLQFASCQVFGRVLRNHMKQLSEHVASGRRALTPIVLEALTSIREILVKNTPRRVTGQLSDHVHIYVDASFEPDGFSGIGGLVLSSDGKCLCFFSEPIGTSLLKQIMSSDQETAIQELEALAVLAAVTTFRSSLTNRKTVVFTDSESVRGAFLKSWSQNFKCSKILFWPSSKRKSVCRRNFGSNECPARAILQTIYPDQRSPNFPL